ncbi:MAG: hypothetical protein WC867_01320 [Candidatus Pacearchaeota archaeon]|jgi:hypothetical protein
MNKKYSSLLGYINGVLIGTLIGFSIYSGVQIYALRKEKSEMMIEESDSRNLESLLTNKSKEYEKSVTPDDSKRKQNNPVNQNYINDRLITESNTDRKMNYQSQTISINE